MHWQAPAKTRSPCTALSYKNVIAPHKGNPDVAKRTSAWVSLAAALVTSQVCGGAIVGPLEGGTAAYDVGDYWKAENPGDSIADDIKVRSERTADGKAIQVEAALALPINHDVVWAVLNDYENMPQFVPDILSTRLISAQPGKKRVEVEGVARLLFLEFPTHTILDVVYRPDGSVAINSVAGNLSVNGVMRMRGDGPFTRVDYQARIAPDFWLPPLIGDFLIGRQIERQFEGMVAEMHRRAGKPSNGGESPALRL